MQPISACETFDGSDCPQSTSRRWAWFVGAGFKPAPTGRDHRTQSRFRAIALRKGPCLQMHGTFVGRFFRQATLIVIPTGGLATTGRNGGIWPRPRRAPHSWPDISTPRCSARYDKGLDHPHHLQTCSAPRSPVTYSVRSAEPQIRGDMNAVQDTSCTLCAPAISLGALLDQTVSIPEAHKTLPAIRR